MAKGFDIMKKRGRIIGVSKDMAIVELDVNRKTCEECSAHSLCGIFPSMRKIKTLNNSGAKVGDLVEVEIKREPSLRFTFLVYILPLIMFFLGVLVTSVTNKNQNVQLVLGGIFFILTLIVLYIVDKRLSNSINNLPKIEKVIGVVKKDVYNR